MLDTFWFHPLPDVHPKFLHLSCNVLLLCPFNLNFVLKVHLRVAEDLYLGAQVENVDVEVALRLDAVVANWENLVWVHSHLVTDFVNLILTQE